MTVNEKLMALVNYCHSRKSCSGCPCYKYEKNGRLCFWSADSEEDINAAYELIFRNPYWERINALAQRQREKGVKTYGQGLEKNPAPIIERIEHLQEELIDGLMYCEWIKEAVFEGALDD